MLRICTYILVFFSLSYNSLGQSYKYTRYSEKDGLKNRFIYTVDQDQRGYLMIGTGEGLFSYDGFSFKEYNTKNGLIHNFITCSTTESNGIIWYGHENGSLTRFDNGKLDTTNLNHFTHSRINQLIVHNQSLWVLTQNDGLLQRNTNNQWIQYKAGLEDFASLYSFYIDDNNSIWLGTDLGLIVASISGEALEYEFVDEISGSKVSCILPHEGQLYIGTEDLGIFLVDSPSKTHKISSLNFEDVDFASYNVNSLYVDQVGDLWICTNNKGLVQLSAFAGGLFRKKKEHLNENALTTQSIRTCTTDREGNIWIGTMGDGLLKIQNSYLTLFPLTNEGAPSPQKVYSVIERNDTIWSGGNGFINLSYGNPDNVIFSIGMEAGLPNDEIISLCLDANGYLWIGTKESGLFKQTAKEKKVIKISLPDGADLKGVHDILIHRNTVYAATNYGVYQFLNEKLISHITIQSGLSVNSVKSLYADIKGCTWLATSTSQITYIEQGEIKNKDSGFKDGVVQIRCIAEDNDGHIWIGTDGLGIVRISGDSIAVVDKESGIYSNYCYSIICDQRNNLWVGHHGAMSKINLLNGKVDVFDPSGELDTDFMDNAVHKTINGSILFGTSNGILRYDPENDTKNEIEPVLRFEGISINDSLVQFLNGIDLGYGKHNISFDFIGISLKKADGVKYQFYLEGYDNDWLPLTSLSSAVYNKLSSGNYVFHVRCYNSDGYGGFTHMSVNVFIDKPFWEKWWFIVACILILISVIRYVIKRRERLLIENQERLQNALDERTKEVVEQKELLEIKNKDITDSILYAKNIQQAMLPAVGQLNRYFPESLVYFKPRDIVSGDFYWVEEFGEIVVVACADCTGHGVPGAFMSLIGSTLLKDVAGYSEVRSSSDVLTYLDKELKEMLHKQDESLSIHDGMDISIMDYNKKTQTLRVSSANRPVVLHINNQWIEIKGDRQTIGGDAGAVKKEFTLHEFNISSGDTIYMFSDGITDQFGGSEGKKLKRSGLKAWLEFSVSLQMNEQLDFIHHGFEDWKKEQAQIDDVILLGIRF